MWVQLQGGIDLRHEISQTLISFLICTVSLQIARICVQKINVLKGKCSGEVIPATI